MPSFQSIIASNLQLWNEYYNASYNNLFQIEYVLSSRLNNRDIFKYINPATGDVSLFSLISPQSPEDRDIVDPIKSIISYNGSIGGVVPPSFVESTSRNDVIKNGIILRAAHARAVDVFVNNVSKKQQLLKEIYELEKMYSENEKFQKEWWHLSSTKRQHNASIVSKAEEISTKYHVTLNRGSINPLADIPNFVTLTKDRTKEQINNHFSTFTTRMQDLNTFASSFPVDQLTQMRTLANSLNQSSSVVYSLTAVELKKELDLEVPKTPEIDRLLETSLMGRSSSATSQAIYDPQQLSVNRTTIITAIESAKTRIESVKQRTDDEEQAVNLCQNASSIVFSGAQIPEYVEPQPPTFLERCKSAIVNFFSGNY